MHKAGEAKRRGLEEDQQGRKQVRLGRTRPGPSAAGLFGASALAARSAPSSGPVRSPPEAVLGVPGQGPEVGVIQRVDVDGRREEPRRRGGGPAVVGYLDDPAETGVYRHLRRSAASAEAPAPANPGVGSDGVAPSPDTPQVSVRLATPVGGRRRVQASGPDAVPPLPVGEDRRPEVRREEAQGAQAPTDADPESCAIQRPRPLGHEPVVGRQVEVAGFRPVLISDRHRPPQTRGHLGVQQGNGPAGDNVADQGGQGRQGPTPTARRLLCALVPIVNLLLTARRRVKTPGRPSV